VKARQAALALTLALMMSACGGESDGAASVEQTAGTGTTMIPSATLPATVPSAPSTVSPMTVSPVPVVPVPTSAAATQVPQYSFPLSPADVATYGQTHHDYPATDIFAPCGTAVVAVTGGVVEEVSRMDLWDPATNDPALRGGLSLSVVGDDGVRYYGSHLLDIVAGIEPGSMVESGDVIAHVGDTGNAAGTGCHLHFGLSPDCGPGDWEVRRGILYPWPYLDAWRGGEQSSPTSEVAEWLAVHADLCAAGDGG